MANLYPKNFYLEDAEVGTSADAWQSPLSSDSDQIPPRSEMTRWAQLRTHAPQQIALYSITSSASSKTASEMGSPSA